LAKSFFVGRAVSFWSLGTVICSRYGQEEGKLDNKKFRKIERGGREGERERDRERDIKCAIET
jgi:hypothetical protein